MNDDIKLENPDEYRAGQTHWFEGEPTFGQLVVKLQEEGKISKSPYTLPLPYLSVSAVETYLRCGKQFYYRYILGRKSPPSVALVQGSTIHKAVEIGYTHVIQNELVPTLDYCLDAYSTDLDARLKEEIVWDDAEDGEVPKDPGKLKDQGVGLVKIWHAEKLPRVKPRKVESSFVTTFGGIPVVGRIDLIDRVEKPIDGVNLAFDPLCDIVADNKVVNRTWAKGAADSKLQFSTYAHATGIPRQRVDLFVKTKVPKIAEMMTSRDAKQIKWAVRMFVEVAKGISSGTFIPCSPESWNCNAKFCGFYNICRGAEL